MTKYEHFTVLATSWDSGPSDSSALSKTIAASQIKSIRILLMHISVVIPAFNAAETIRTTLDSVLAQTISPDEILVVNDGSTDGTASLLRSYQPRISVFTQNNSGPSHSRNILCKHAQGNLVAFLDADDVWHPRYLEYQRQFLEENPRAVACFSDHTNFQGYGKYEWKEENSKKKAVLEYLNPGDFLSRYNTCTGLFASMSYCCVPKWVLRELGEKPFQFNGAEDAYFFNQLPLLGPVLFAKFSLAAYRITDRSLSSNRLKCICARVQVFDSLKVEYDKPAAQHLRPIFQRAFASHRRLYGKLLMGAGRIEEARTQLRYSVSESNETTSKAKSLAYIAASYLPNSFQPRWPSIYRQ
jgi:glycosyltransferase involved in cell wall biosynthesis